MRFYGEGIPGVEPGELAGTLIVIEGADGSGRSTQMELLRDFLENRGHATLNVGLRRSTLVSEELAEAKKGNVLGEITRSLFYATDFADQLENRIIPALKAGFIVLADRYIYTLMARDIVRGADREWVRSLYGMALIPHLVIYLRVSPGQLVERNFRKNATLDYWESGMDLGLSRDIFDSFIRYQRLIQKEFALMEHEYGFHMVNGNRSVRSVAGEIFARVEGVLGGGTDE
ncbi:thymidylate kinase [Geotalea uraniireducens]|uniref:Thymidylate kinase n=1 Tax=Geotalea uraniireducens TaxID=351604 RepID=A0ABN6VZE8_9BACT|nr:thymidylate kinase [Geotalea uraniireducens]BDV44085.1 thymidylate kinase [Geotalea uraniireducens]